MTERLGLNARIVTPEEKAAEKWLLRRYGYTDPNDIRDKGMQIAFLAGVEWERKQILKERLDKWDGKNLRNEVKK